MAERSPEEDAYERDMQMKINSISEWIVDHGPITDQVTAAWVMEQVEPMLSDDIRIFGDRMILPEDHPEDEWWSFSFTYPRYTAPQPEPQEG